MAFTALQSGLLVPKGIKPSTEPVAGEDALRIRSHADSSDPAAALDMAGMLSLLRTAATGTIADQAKLFDAMEERDNVIYHALDIRRSGPLSCPGEVLPPEDTSDEALAQEAVDLVKENIAALNGTVGLDSIGDGVVERGSFRSVMRSHFDAIGKGFAVVEPLWETSEKQWRWKGAEWRPQSWFQFGAPASPDLTIKGTELRLRDATVTGQRLNPLNIWDFRYAAKSGWPARQALMRVLARAFMIRNYAWKDFLQFGELFGVPFRFGTFPQGTEPADVDRFWQSILRMGANGAAIAPEGSNLSFPQPGGAASGAGSTILERILTMAEADIIRAVIGQTATSGEGGGWSNNGAQQAVRWDLLDNDCLEYEGFLSSCVFAPLVALNLGPEAPVPIYQFKRQEPVDIVQVAQAAQILVGLGLPIAAADIRKQTPFREPEEGEELLTAPALPPSPFGASGGFAATDRVGTAGARPKNGRRPAMSGPQTRYVC